MATGSGTLIDQANLAENLDFRRRVRASLVHNAIAVMTEVLNDVQTVSITGSPTGGTFTLTWNGLTTGMIIWKESAGGVQKALEPLTGVGIGNVVCTGGPLPATPVVVTFQNVLGNMSQPVMTGTGTLLTGGASPAVAVAHTTNGVAAPVHAARAAFGKLILLNPDGYASLLAIGVADSATVAADFDVGSGALAGGKTESGVSTDINNQVSAIFNSYI
jgi:hypothetical protein